MRLPQGDRVPGHAGDFERRRESPSRQHSPQRRFQRGGALRCRIQRVRPDQMDMTVPEAGDHRSAVGVEDRTPSGMRMSRAEPDALNASVAHENRCIGQRRCVR
jgi:hypothetical protein